MRRSAARSFLLLGASRHHLEAVERFQLPREVPLQRVGHGSRRRPFGQFIGAVLPSQGAIQARTSLRELQRTDTTSLVGCEKHRAQRRFQVT
jgi:hypothetical protein